MSYGNIFLPILCMAGGVTGFAQTSAPVHNDGRNSAAAILGYPLPDSTSVVAFYNELMVQKGADLPPGYFMACGFARGYLGLQVNNKKERLVSFYVWNASGVTAHKKVADSNKVILNGKGENVFVSDFANDGTGAESNWKYNWKADSTYPFLVTAMPDSASNTTTYSGYFFVPELKAWKFIASFILPHDGKFLAKPYAGLQNLTNGQSLRKAYYANGWVRVEDGKWTELHTATLSFNAVKAGSHHSYGGGTENNRFYLTHGYVKPESAANAGLLIRDTTGIKPTINLYNHVDSALQARKEIAIVNKAVRDGVTDTTGSIQGVWYRIDKEGTGPQVTGSDTVTVRYKGFVLNGEVFDSTEKEPAVFPLNRLIKGYQLGLPMSKVGGKIRLIIPSGLAYSIRSRAYKIPPNSILVFDIEVLGSVKK